MSHNPLFYLFTTSAKLPLTKAIIIHSPLDVEGLWSIAPEGAEQLVYGTMRFLLGFIPELSEHDFVIDY